MKMEDLNKNQVVLLTLLVSFVTSIATGIVTVTLMDQAPPGFTQTINKVVEKTIQTILPGENQVTTVVKETIVKEGDLVANAVEKSLKNLVQIKAVDGEGAEISLSMGVIVSGDGYVVTDKSNIDGNRNNLVIQYGKVSFAADIIEDDKNEFAILKIGKAVSAGGGAASTTNASAVSFIPVSSTDSNNIRLGQLVIALGGETGDTVVTGIVSRLEMTSADSGSAETGAKKEILKYIVTDMGLTKKSAGGPLFDTAGNVVGVNVVTGQGGIVMTVPINTINAAILALAKNAQNSGSKPAGN